MNCRNERYVVQIVARGKEWARWYNFSDYLWNSSYWYDWSLEEPWIFFADELELPF